MDKVDIMTKEHDKNLRFFQLYTGAHVRLYGFLLAILHDHGDAEDLLQETAAILWEKFDTYQAGTNFGAWATQIAKHKAFEFLRFNKKTRMVLNEQLYLNISDYYEKHSDDYSERTVVLKKCMAKLGENERELLLLRYKRDITVKIGRAHV